MSTNANEVRFPCPNCGQKLGCEDGYGGWRIQCPTCGGGVVVPLRTVPVRPTAVIVARSASPGVFQPPAAGQPQSRQHFLTQFAAGFGQALGGFVSAVVGLLAAFGLLVGACTGACALRGLPFIPVELAVGVVVFLMAFSRVWDRLWD